MFLTVLRAEWTKARTVRSTWWSLVATAALCIGLGVLIGSQMVGSPTAESSRDVAQISFLPLLLGQITLVVFGVLLASAEYTTGTILASLAAVPRRGAFLAAKAVVAALISAVVAVVVTFGTFLAVQWPLGDRGVSLGDPGVLPAALRACAFLVMMCVFAMGMAAVLRSSALTLGILIPLLFLSSQGLSSLPAIRSVTQFLPDQAGAVMMQVGDGQGILVGERAFGPAGAFLVLLGWVGAALVGGYLSLRRRDA